MNRFPSMQTFTITQQFSDSELYRITINLMQRARIVRLMLVVVMIPVLISVALPFIWKLPAEGFGIIPFLFPGFILFILFAGPYVLIKLNRKSSAKVYISFDENGMIAGANQEYRKSWNEFDYWRESKEFFFIYMPNVGMMAHTIKKNAFASVEEINAFRKLLTEKLKQK